MTRISSPIDVAPIALIVSWFTDAIGAISVTAD